MVGKPDCKDKNKIATKEAKGKGLSPQEQRILKNCKLKTEFKGQEEFGGKKEVNIIHGTVGNMHIYLEETFPLIKSDEAVIFSGKINGQDIASAQAEQLWNAYVHIADMQAAKTIDEKV